MHWRAHDRFWTAFLVEGDVDSVAKCVFGSPYRDHAVRAGREWVKSHSATGMTSRQSLFLNRGDQTWLIQCWDEFAGKDLPDPELVCLPVNLSNIIKYDAA